MNITTCSIEDFMSFVNATIDLDSRSFIYYSTHQKEKTSNITLVLNTTHHTVFHSDFYEDTEVQQYLDNIFKLQDQSKYNFVVQQYEIISYTSETNSYSFTNFLNVT